MADLNEEPWELEIGAMLGAMPEVAPPSGFIDSALDHRPLYAGRVLGGMLILSVVAVVGSVVTGAVGRSRVTPEIDELAARHTSVTANVVGGAGFGNEVDYRIDTGVAMPDGFERTHNIATDDLRQALYAKGDEAVSVFVQEGRLQWEALPADGLTEIDGLQAWVDEDRQWTVVETPEGIVTIVGLPAEDVGEVLAEVPRTGPSSSSRAQDLVEAITEQLGYSALD